MDGINARDLLNRGVGFMAGVNAVLKISRTASGTNLFMFTNEEREKELRKMLDAYVKKLIADHRRV